MLDNSLSIAIDNCFCLSQEGCYEWFAKLTQLCDAHQILTPRKIQIATLVAKGLTNAEIGKQLWITQNSVKQALKRMFRKLNVSARTEMVAKLRNLV